jgi:hypothetical protein
MMWLAAVFEEKNALPGAKLHLTVNNRDGFARVCEDHANVRGAIVAAFGRVDKIVGVFRYEVLKKFLQVFPRRAIGVFHDNETATGVLDENSRYAIAHAGFVDLTLNFVGDLVRAFAVRGDFKPVMANAHA